MQPLVFSPKFVIEKILKLPFKEAQVKQFQQVAGVPERRTRDWFAKGRMGKNSEFRELMRTLSEDESCTWCPVSSKEFIRMFIAPTWGEYAGVWLLNRDNAFRRTMGHLMSTQYLNRNSKAWKGNLHRLGSCLSPEIVNRLDASLEQSGVRQEQRCDIIEVLAFIMTLALLESEYFDDMQMDALFMEKLLPRYFDREKRLASTPVEIFFQRLLDGLVERSLFKNQDHLVKNIEIWTELEYEDVLRYINRYRAGEAVPLWGTFNKWAELIATRYIRLEEKREGADYTLEESEKRIKDQVVHLQNLFGGALLLDGVFRFSHKILAQAGLEPVAFFRKEYATCAELLGTWKKGAEEPPPCV